MPKPSLENPFVNQPAGNPDTAAYVEKILGKKEADKYRTLELESSHRRTIPRPKDEEIELMDEDRTRMAEREKEIAEAREKRETRQRLIEWAEEFDLGKDLGLDAEEWVDKKFKFLPSGEAECWEGLWVPNAMRFPRGIVRVGRDLHLSGLASAQGLDLPRTVGGFLQLGRLSSAQGLELPWTIGGDLYLQSLTSAQGLELPETIGGSLYLQRLTSAQGLNLPQTIVGKVYLDNLPLEEKQQLKKRYPNLRIE